jgi:hypothetical protein
MPSSETESRSTTDRRPTQFPALTAGTTRWMWRPLVNIQHQTPRRAAPARLCFSSLPAPMRDGADSRQAGLAFYSRAASRLPARGDIMASPRLLSNMARLPCLFRPQPWLKAAPFPRPPARSHSPSLQPRLGAMPAAAPRSPKTRRRGSVFPVAACTCEPWACALQPTGGSNESPWAWDR